MRTTVDIHDPLLDRAKRFAAAEGKRLADVVNEALLEMLSRAERTPRTREPFRMITFGKGEPSPTVDLSSNASVQEAFDEECRDPQTGEFDLTKLR
jgi:hypothetical protein